MTEILKVPFNRSYWVVPEKLLAGGYPGSENPIEEKRNLKGLIQAGIRHVISLMEPKEYSRLNNSKAENFGYFRPDIDKGFLRPN